MLGKVKKYIEQYQMLSSEDCVIVGVSGGADSVCLLFVLRALQKEMGFSLVAVHVNHGLRGDAADEDEAYVKQLCAEYGILCESYFAPVELIAKNRKQSTEEAGRDVRRECFEKAACKYGATKIALAHHQNDSAETFLWNLARGTGLKGLGGIRPVKGNVIRPLLCVERTEIERYLQTEGISYCTDQTNKSDMYTRNRIRNHLLPYMQEHLNTQTVRHMNETMEQLRGVQDFLEEQMLGYRAVCVQETTAGYVILKEPFETVPEVIKPLLLRDVLATITEKEKDLEAIHLKQLQELFEKQTGRKVDLPYGAIGRRIYEGVEIVSKEETHISTETVVFDLREKEAEFQWQNNRICCRVLDRTELDELAEQKSHTKWFDCDIIKNMVCFRTRRPGDYLTIHEDGGTQKLKSFFINEKIPQDRRDEIMLVADESHILWVEGYRVNPVYRVTEHTKHVLEIRINKGEQDERED